MADVRTPIQKRSLEKKQKIINAGFELFCEKGYYQTSTNEICKRAGVSTGALYSYFTDKKDIFIASFEIFFKEQIDPLISSLVDNQNSFDLDKFISHAIDVFTKMYQLSEKGIAELSNMMSKDKDILNAFRDYSDKNLVVFIEILVSNKINATVESLYLVYAIIDAIAQENNIQAHNDINYEVLKSKGINTIKALLME
ncbi:TetR/AcrR family transcriptional regulator [Listeria seeligeri]|uniref:TetR/AcrR family transcriptional regulator n=2 Tax=Listeria TaxID=1637 RepID=UPI001628CF2A|nr:TetR/AcrR family transcriptional regulator [Listeria seeligeri]MBC1444032.1 TetR/AcrR family transcriptional regulator [Listeria seeligeri]MBC1773738.1 TetR/AcrR family transcriptional regulator [Listeria seeligeri]MBF2384502.1 TetR/AcrR family transcriptional regulator [Listeria seeligeri]MBF2541738.1 TetR/AcrR family transcriptional regulator [Listeria seeligeri]MBF2590231.1 TetR/AcrR family transcriptional regulator [Listeria seeligeri]